MPKRADRNLDDSTDANNQGSGYDEIALSGVRGRDRRRYVSSAQRPEGRAAARWKQASVLERMRWGFVGPPKRTDTKRLDLDGANASGTIVAKITPPRSRPQDLKVIIENDILEVQSPEGMQWQLKLPEGTPSENIEITTEQPQLVIRIIEGSQTQRTSGEPQPTPSEDPPAHAVSDVNLIADLRELSELLAVDAHERWLKARLAQGWRYGRLDANTLTHPSLVPYSDLPESEKEYDRRFAEATLRTMLRLGVSLDRVHFPLPPMPQVDLPDDLRELIEPLGDATHEKWLVP